MIRFLKIFLLLGFFGFAQTTSTTFKLEQKTPEEFPFYQILVETTNGKTNFKKKYQYIDTLNFYGFNYKSFDDLTIRGFMVAPKEKGIYPVIIFNRGGNNTFGAVPFSLLASFLGKIASQGYIIIGSQLRGGTPNSGQDEFGGKDVNDVLQIFDIIDQLPNADKTKISMLGWSRGVITNFQILKKTNRIKNCISIAGLTDLSKTHRPEMFKVYRSCIPDYSKDSINKLKSRSCLMAVDSIKNQHVNFLLVHGTKDSRVKVENTYWLSDKLAQKKYKYQLKIYEGGEHDLKEQLDDLITTIINWLKSVS